MNAVHPTPGTDNAVLLDALLDAYPGWVSRPNSRLNVMAHSRASDLRRMGWSIEAKRFPDPERPRKGEWCYRLTTLPVPIDAGGNPVLFGAAS